MDTPNEKQVLIIKNISSEGPGLIREILESFDIRYKIVDLEKGENFPDPQGYSAIIVMGGSDSANDSTDKIQNELKRIKEAIDQGIPYLGVCLGMQLLVKAGGGEVYRNEIQEIGWRAPDGNFFEIELTNEGKSDPLFVGVAFPLKTFHLHSETVRLTNGMQLLATGKYCRNQIVKIGDCAYGIQCHCELTPDMLDAWIADDSDLAVLDQRTLRTDYVHIKDGYEKNGKRIFTNFFRLAGLIQ